MFSLSNNILVSLSNSIMRCVSNIEKEQPISNIDPNIDPNIDILDRLESQEPLNEKSVDTFEKQKPTKIPIYIPQYCNNPLQKHTKH